MKIKLNIPNAVINPAMTFQAANLRALGLNLEIIRPAARTPTDFPTKVKVPVKKLKEIKRIKCSW